MRDSLGVDPKKCTKMAVVVKGVREETTTGIHRLKEMADKGEFLFPIISANDCVSKSQFDTAYRCRRSLSDGIMPATDVTIRGRMDKQRHGYAEAAPPTQSSTASFRP